MGTNWLASCRISTFRISFVDDDESEHVAIRHTLVLPI